MQHWNIENQYPNISIPGGWVSIHEFADWYFAAGKPMMVPWNAVIVHIDNSSSVTLFRHGEFQVEMYIIHPGYGVPIHAHPGVDIITVRMGGGKSCGGPHHQYNTGTDAGRFVFTPAGEKHNFPAQAGGFVLLSLEHWKTGPLSSAAKRWSGADIGPAHKDYREQNK